MGFHRPPHGAHAFRVLQRIPEFEMQPAVDNHGEGILCQATRRGCGHLSKLAVEPIEGPVGIAG